MTKKMLIDATQPEETRVAVIEKGRLVDFDYESKVRKTLKSSIFLAKVTRVEPSLQAAFVNFGGNRHGFLPFSEIHPDYFRIPVADREALIAAQQEALAQHDAEAEEDEHEDSDDKSQDDKALDDVAEDDEEGDVHADTDPDSSEGESDDSIEEPLEDVFKDDGRYDDHPHAESENSESENAEPEGDESEDNEDQDGVEGNAHDEGIFDDDFDAEALDKAVDGNKVGGSGEEQNDAENQKGDGRRNNRRGRGRGNKGNNRGRSDGRGRRYAQSRSKRSEKRERGGDDQDRPFRFNLRRQYKIQEVVKRGQIMLIQVSKEERGNKGAAVTTYLSLPGRYCVLMPNSPRGGGVSRKIASFKDRKRMREILNDLETPDGMSVILRTAGLVRTKAEIKRDLDYLVRLWNNTRELTLQSTAPSLIYEEADLIKRSIRDLYTPDIDEVFVAGSEGYKSTKNFMKMMIPSHAKRVKEYKSSDESLFQSHKVEDQISEIGETSVKLKSGGYLVINPTEALVSVDVNSGRATKERHIEETALKTNLEAAEEVARQLRLRDLGGLVVIDFIDMEDRRNNRKVENRLRDSLSIDRARIQVGRISMFGLLEMSRQRLNPSLAEMQFQACSHCEGTGFVRTLDSAALIALRDVQQACVKNARLQKIIVRVPNDMALYILNNKRDTVADIENRYNLLLDVRVDEEMLPSTHHLEVVKQSQNTDKQGDSDSEEKEEDNSAEDSKEKQRSGGRKRGRRGGRRRNAREGRDRDDAQDKQGQDKQSIEETAKDDKKDSSDSSQKKSSKTSSRTPASNKTASKKTAKKGPKEDKKEDLAKQDSKEDSKEKTSKKTSGKKPASRKPATKKKPANDKEQPENKPKDYEVVNEAPKEKKKGWWSKITQ